MLGVECKSNLIMYKANVLLNYCSYIFLLSNHQRDGNFLSCSSSCFVTIWNNKGDTVVDYIDNNRRWFRALYWNPLDHNLLAARAEKVGLL